MSRFFEFSKNVKTYSRTMMGMTFLGHVTSSVT